jgi:4-coumarate--CoA ligase
MVGLLRLKSLETSLKAIVQTIRFTNGSVEWIRNVSRLQCRTISGVSSSGTSTSVGKNIIYSRHQDFDFRSQTVIQRIFEKASLWPNLTATVSFFVNFSVEREPQNISDDLIYYRNAD